MAHEIPDKDVEIVANNWQTMRVATAGGVTAGCSISITRYVQNGATVTPTTIDVRYDLTVEGTASPNNSNLTGMFSANGSGHSLTIIASGGMNWYAVVSKSWFPPAGQNGYLFFNKQCSSPPPAQTGATLTFV